MKLYPAYTSGSFPENTYQPMFADEKGILGVYGIGVNTSRSAEELPAVMIKIEKIGG